MSTKEQTADILGILATVAIMGVGFAIGGTIGASVMAGIGINLSSEIIQKGSSKLREQWLSSDNGILNHDLQNALVRAFLKALTDLELKYFALGEANALPRHERVSILALFDQLREYAPQVFATSIQRAAQEQEVRDYLYAAQEVATDILWKRIDRTDLLSTYGGHFKDFLRRNLLIEVQYHFGEELKTDTRESNKAWRAFQRLLLEGIRADIKATQASQDLIRQDLRKMDGLRDQLEQLQDTVDRRLPNELFLQDFETAINQMHSALQNVAATTKRIDNNVNIIRDHMLMMLARQEPPRPGPLDQERFAEEISNIRRNMMVAHSGRDLQEALYRVDELLEKSPHHSQARLLRDQIITAIQREIAIHAQPAESVRSMPHIQPETKPSVITRLIWLALILAVVGGLSYLVYLSIR